MSVRTRTLAIGGLAAVAGSALLAPTPAAAAEPEEISCNRGAFCIYTDDEPPRQGTLTDGVYDLGGWAGGVLNDNVNWFWNLTDDNWCVYEHAGYEGAVQVVSPGYSGNLDGFGGRTSSLRSRPWHGC
ncbi:peptidase inhibitor family I36 protein [Phytomonospora sp. NPDC050363]|uniref:peptidase inhibitor family I36 protein n=1 Tax=Phytomonospora sp. NPDC050363 TaxID=3155642 RepID=UPI0033CFAFCE